MENKNKLYCISYKPCGVVGRVEAPTPKEAVKMFLDIDPYWEYPERLKASIDYYTTKETLK